jgi:hypothetical protein
VPGVRLRKQVSFVEDDDNGQELAAKTKRIPSHVELEHEAKVKQEEHAQEEKAVKALSVDLLNDRSAQVSDGIWLEVLKAESTSPSQGDFRTLHVVFSALPFDLVAKPNSTAKDTVTKMLVRVARLVLDAGPMELDVDFRSADPVEGGIKYAEPAGGDSIPNHLLPLITKDVPDGLLPLLGLAETHPRAEHHNKAFVTQILAVLKASRIRISNLSPHHDDRHQWESARPLIQVGRMPLALAGNAYYTKPRHVLNYLEIGPWMPISNQCETEYRFPFASWQIRVVAFRLAPYLKRGLLSRSRRENPIPGIFWDPSFGFVAMMSRPEAEETERVKTRIVLIVDDLKQTTEFAVKVEQIAASETAMMADASEVAARLRMFKKMFYFVCPGVTSEVNRVWSEARKAKKLKRDQAEDRPGGTQEQEERNIRKVEGILDGKHNSLNVAPLKDRRKLTVDRRRSER